MMIGMVRLGFALPQFGALAQVDDVRRFAATAEELGAASLWVGDRLLAPVDPVVGYGGRDTVPVEFRRILDPFALMTVAAVATSAVTIGSNVLNLPWYQPALLARSLTSIDLLSGGRLIAGFGIGWSPDEYVAAGVPWPARGARLDDYLSALDALWTSNPAAYEGRFTTVPAAHIDLRPARRPPVYLGGRAPAALRRIARRADGWLPVARVPGRFDADGLRAQRAVVGDLPAVLRVNVAAGASVSAVVDVLSAAADAGLEDVFVDLMYLARDVDHALALAAELLAATR